MKPSRIDVDTIFSSLFLTPLSSVLLYYFATSGLENLRQHGTTPGYPAESGYRSESYHFDPGKHPSSHCRYLYWVEGKATCALRLPFLEIDADHPPNC